MNSYQIKQGKLIHAAWCPSPNFSSRPEHTPIDTLVIHGISLPPGHFGGNFVQHFFTNQLNPADHAYFEQIKQLKVSSHLFISRTGQVTQFVNFADRAWHAGRSQFKGRARVNDFSIGIELEGTDTCPYTLFQYQTLAKITQALIHTYPALNTTGITGHSDIAPGRKTDPGPAFDWSHYFQLLENIRS